MGIRTSKVTRWSGEGNPAEMAGGNRHDSFSPSLSSSPPTTIGASARGTLPLPFRRKVKSTSPSVDKIDSVPSTPLVGAFSSAGCTSSEGMIMRDRFIKENNETVVTQFYSLEAKPLGSGTYGSVTKGINNATSQPRAVKTVAKNSVKSVERFRTEISIMKSLDHPNIVKLFETFEDSRCIYLVMELCLGGELFDRIIEVGHFTEKDAAIFMRQIFAGVHYLHSNNVMHRDLKPENFLFLDRHDSTLKIIDFGLSCKFKEGQLCATKAGTPYYVAPQVLSGSYDRSCDYWSCGVIMFILLCGYPPFYGDSDQEVLVKVKSGQFNFNGPEWKGISEDAKELISSLLTFSPKERMTAEGALGHAWLKNLTTMAARPPLPPTLVHNLRGFRAQNKLKKAALTVIAQHLAEKEIENLKNVFFTLDTDHSGTLSIEEVTEGLKKLGWSEIPPDIQQIIQEVDSDGSGYIDYTEFIAATMDRKLYLRKDILWAAFRVFDLDGNGKISQEELRQVMVDEDIQETLGTDLIDRLLDDVDLNGDGEIDFEEFMTMMRRRTPSDFPLASKRRPSTARRDTVSSVSSCQGVGRKLPSSSSTLGLRFRLPFRSPRRSRMPQTTHPTTTPPFLSAKFVERESRRAETTKTRQRYPLDAASEEDEDPYYQRSGNSKPSNYLHRKHHREQDNENIDSNQLRKAGTSARRKR